MTRAYGCELHAEFSLDLSWDRVNRLEFSFQESVNEQLHRTVHIGLVFFLFGQLMFSSFRAEEHSAFHMKQEAWVSKRMQLNIEALRCSEMVFVGYGCGWSGPSHWWKLISFSCNFLHRSGTKDSLCFLWTQNSSGTESLKTQQHPVAAVWEVVLRFLN